MASTELNASGNRVMDLHPIQEGVEMLLVASCYRNQDKLRSDGPHASYNDLIYFVVLGNLKATYVHDGPSSMSKSLKVMLMSISGGIGTTYIQSVLFG